MITDQDAIESVPPEVIAKLKKLIQAIYDAGLDGGEITADAIDKLNEYCEKLRAC